MSGLSREFSSRSMLFLLVLGLLSAGIPGCGDGADQKETGGVSVPPTVQQSNKNMEDFMKSQAAKKK